MCIYISSTRQNEKEKPVNKNETSTYSEGFSVFNVAPETSDSFLLTPELITTV